MKNFVEVVIIRIPKWKTSYQIVITESFYTRIVLFLGIIGEVLGVGVGESSLREWSDTYLLPNTLKILCQINHFLDI